MAEWILGGRLIDLIVLAVLVEWAVLGILHHRTGRGLSWWQLLPNLAAGLCLMLALRAALTSAGWIWIAFLLALSGLAHVADLRGRWPRRSV